MAKRQASPRSDLMAAGTAIKPTLEASPRSIKGLCRMGGRGGKGRESGKAGGSREGGREGQGGAAHVFPRPRMGELKPQAKNKVNHCMGCGAGGLGEG